MPQERVLHAATRLNTTSRRLLEYLASHDMPHKSAAAPLSPAATAHLSQVTAAQIPAESARHTRPRPRRRDIFWSWEDDEWGEAGCSWRDWVGPDELTTTEAARAFRVTPATIRQWVNRGHLQPLRRQGRTMVFSARAVFDAAIATGERNKQPGGPLRRDRRHVELAGRYLSAKAMSQLVTAETAGAALGLSASTIRSWRHRGLLAPARMQGRTPLYQLADVVAKARRTPYHAPRKDRLTF